MIDLHSHVLPGVDDGAPTLEAAIAMCRTAAADGCTALVATPHLRHPSFPNGDRALLERRYEELRTAIEGVLELHLGAEIRVDSELLAEVDRLPGGSLLSLARSRYLLLELDPWSVGAEAETLVHELAVSGWYPILAHPELIPPLAEDLELLARLVERGALLQLTAMSVTGAFGGRAERSAWRMLDAGWVFLVASDCHRPDYRPPGLSTARRVLAERLGEEAADRLTRDHGRRVLDDLPPFEADA